MNPSDHPAAVEAHLVDELGLLRAVIDAVPDPIFCKDRAGRYLLTNRAHSARLQVPHGTCLGKTAFDLPQMSEFASLYHADDVTVLETGTPVLNREEPFAWPDGSRGWYLTSKYPLRNAQGEVAGLVGIARNITQRRQAEHKLDDERRLLRTVVDAVADPIFFKDQAGRFLLVNATYETFFGLPISDVLGKTDAEIARLIGYPEGSLDDYVADDRNVIESGVALINREEPFIKRDGSQGWFLTSKFPLRDGEGRIIGLVGIARDISDRRSVEAEKKQIERKLQESQKLESLGVLAGGIAHDFNNLLTGVLGNASLAAMDLPPDSPVMSCVEQIEVASMRAADLCKQMLAYSGKGRFVIRRHDLNAVITETTNLLRVSISKSATLNLDLARTLPPVLADATQLRQIVMNLVINASESLGESGGAIRISTGLVRAGRETFSAAHLAPDLPEGDYVFLEVTDTGCGMPPDVRERIFDPFFTTKFTGRGLGLAAVLGIVRGHDGALQVESQPGHGTIFRVLLPAVEGTAETDTAPGDAENAWRGQGTVLLIDDEETVRTTATQMLQAMGFEVQTAVDGVAGVEAFRAAPESFAAVLLDLTMPQLDGEGVFQALRELRPDIRVVLMSGYNEVQVAARFGGDGPAAFIQKPFRLPSLREKLRALLD